MFASLFVLMGFNLRHKAENSRKTGKLEKGKQKLSQLLPLVCLCLARLLSCIIVCAKHKTYKTAAKQQHKDVPLPSV